MCIVFCSLMMCLVFIGLKVATRLLLPKPSAGNITVTNLIRYPHCQYDHHDDQDYDEHAQHTVIRFTSLNLLFSISVLVTFFFNFFFTSSALNIRNMLGTQQNAMLVCLLLTNKEVG